MIIGAIMDNSFMRNRIVDEKDENPAANHTNGLGGWPFVDGGLLWPNVPLGRGVDHD